MKFVDLLRFEWKLQIQRWSSLLLLALFALLIGYGALSGIAERDQRLTAIDQHHSAMDAAMEDWLGNLRQLEELGSDAEVPPWSGSAMDVVFASSLPQRPIADFAVGQSDLLPYLGMISLWDPDIRLFSKYEFADPVSLAMGNFDISKAVILFLPLILIVFCFDVIAAERDNRRLSLTIAQGVRIRRLFWQRLLFRAALVLALCIAIAILVLLLGSPDSSLADRIAPFAVWSLFTLFYGAFWVLLIAFVASFNRSGEFNVLAMLGAWVGLTLLIPAAGSATAEVLNPTPSRLTYLAEAREVENETRLEESDVANQFMLDHPELLVDQSSEIPGFVLSSFLVTSTVDEATRPIVESFEQAMAKRSQTINLFAFLSPAVATHNLFIDLAGTSSHRHQQYLQQARQFKAEYAELVGPNIVAKRPISSEFYATLPAFRFIDESLSDSVQRAAAPFLFLTLTGLVLLTVTNRRLARISPVDH